MKKKYFELVKDNLYLIVKIQNLEKIQQNSFQRAYVPCSDLFLFYISHIPQGDPNYALLWLAG